ncbi:hypothetical protein PO902_16850 [Planococcus maritimus]|nr:hypothetical protein [Planococcus sp. SK3692]MDE4086717.1 hypothetical protein [Planococcus maritimus]
MANTFMFNIGDIITTFFLLGFFVLAILLVMVAVKASSKNKKLQADETDLKNRIEALEMRIEKLENE